MKASIFDRYGGFSSVHKVILSFYDKMLDSDIVGPYFEEVDMPALVDHQTKFISQVMGGPVFFSDEVLEQVHRNLGVTQEAFDEMVVILESTLIDFEFKADDVNVVMAEIKSRQAYIVNAR